MADSSTKDQVGELSVPRHLTARQRLQRAMGHIADRTKSWFESNGLDGPFTPQLLSLSMWLRRKRDRMDAQGGLPRAAATGYADLLSGDDTADAVVLETRVFASAVATVPAEHRRSMVAIVASLMTLLNICCDTASAEQSSMALSDADEPTEDKRVVVADLGPTWLVLHDATTSPAWIPEWAAFDGSGVGARWAAENLKAHLLAKGIQPKKSNELTQQRCHVASIDREADWDSTMICLMAHNEIWFFDVVPYPAVPFGDARLTTAQKQLGLCATDHLSNATLLAKEVAANGVESTPEGNVAASSVLEAGGGGGICPGLSDPRMELLKSLLRDLESQTTEGGRSWHSMIELIGHRFDKAARDATVEQCAARAWLAAVRKVRGLSSAADGMETKEYLRYVQDCLSQAILWIDALVRPFLRVGTVPKGGHDFSQYRRLWQLMPHLFPTDALPASRGLPPVTAAAPFSVEAAVLGIDTIQESNAWPNDRPLVPTGSTGFKKKAEAECFMDAVAAAVCGLCVPAAGPVDAADCVLEPATSAATDVDSVLKEINTSVTALQECLHRYNMTGHPFQMINAVIHKLNEASNAPIVESMRSMVSECVDLLVEPIQHVDCHFGCLSQAGPCTNLEDLPDWAQQLLSVKPQYEASMLRKTKLPNAFIVSETGWMIARRN